MVENYLTVCLLSFISRSWNFHFLFVCGINFSFTISLSLEFQIQLLLRQVLEIAKSLLSSEIYHSATEFITTCDFVWLEIFRANGMTWKLLAEVEAGTLHGRQRKETIELELVLPRARKKKKNISLFHWVSIGWRERCKNRETDKSQKWNWA